MGGGAGPLWPRWDGEARLMRFDTPAGGGPEIVSGRESLSAIAADLAADPRLEPEERCAVAAGVERRQPETAAVLAGPLDC